MNSWNVKLEVRVPFSKIIQKRALSEMFVEYMEESVVKFLAQSEHFSASASKGYS
jgi:hypothetical protein